MAEVKSGSKVSLSLSGVVVALVVLVAVVFLATGMECS